MAPRLRCDGGITPDGQGVQNLNYVWCQLVVADIIYARMFLVERVNIHLRRYLSPICLMQFPYSSPSSLCLFFPYSSTPPFGFSLSPAPWRCRVGNIRYNCWSTRRLAQHSFPSLDVCLFVEMIGDDECMLGHEEADVNMISYALIMSTEHGCRQIQIVSDHPDVFVLLVYFYWKLRPFAAITMKRFDGKTIDIYK